MKPLLVLSVAVLCCLRVGQLFHLRLQVPCGGLYGFDGGRSFMYLEGIEMLQLLKDACCVCCMNVIDDGDMRYRV